jgi:hypothetical protein
MQPLSASTLLTAWEMGRIRHPIDRALLLFALAEPSADRDSLADRPLGERNIALLGLRQTTFGNRLRAYLDCPACGERLEVELDAAELLAGGTASSDTDRSIAVNGLRFRRPTSRDLAAVEAEPGVEAAALKLLASCLVDDGSAAPTPAPALASWMDRIEAALDQADPLADLALAFQCDACGYSGTAPFDIGAFLWEEVEARAQGLLDEVHLLARAYGWRESDVLGLSESRRAAYVERVTT